MTPCRGSACSCTWTACAGTRWCGSRRRPGAGKTTLVASWLESRALPGIWYQIDSGDADAATFFYYLGLAARPWQRRRRPLPLLTPEFLGDCLGFARRWFRDLFARFGPDHVLVLDNLNELPEGSPLLAALAAAAEEVPAAEQMIVVSRQEPGTEFARLAANKALSVIDADSLRLTARKPPRSPPCASRSMLPASSSCTN